MIHICIGMNLVMNITVIVIVMIVVHIGTSVTTTSGKMGTGQLTLDMRQIAVLVQHYQRVMMRFIDLVLQFLYIMELYD